MPAVSSKKSTEQVAKLADMLSAMGSEPRLRIMQLLLSAHPDGLVVTEIQDELEIPNSTLSHHLEKLKGEDLVRVQRERRTSGVASVPVRGVLHSKQGRQARTDRSTL
jgi:predicted transcriptional regulator